MQCTASIAMLGFPWAGRQGPQYSSDEAGSLIKKPLMAVVELDTILSAPVTMEAPLHSSVKDSAMTAYVQYGAGLCSPREWVNFDVSPTLRLQRLPLVGPLFDFVGPKFPAGVRFGDIISGLPVPLASCDAMYCSHTLEHLALDDLRKALRNTFRHLKPGGRFRFVLPDLEQLARDYLASADVDASLVFMKDSCLGKPSRPRGLSGILRAGLGNTSHLWMWDYKSMYRELVDAGFHNIRRAQYGDSGDPMFAFVEDPGRWDKCLGIECWRP
jgi:SAM-dependent methyltransferase